MNLSRRRHRARKHPISFRLIKSQVPAIVRHVSEQPSSGSPDIGLSSLARQSMSGPAIKYACDVRTSLTCLTVIAMNRAVASRCAHSNPDDDDSYAGVVAGKVRPLEMTCAQSRSRSPVSKISGQSIGTCWPWQMEFVDTNAAAALVIVPVVGSLHEPASHIVERLPVCSIGHRRASAGLPSARAFCHLLP